MPVIDENLCLIQFLERMNKEVNSAEGTPNGVKGHVAHKGTLSVTQESECFFWGAAKNIEVLPSRPEQYPGNFSD
ncbi:hypothetical protein RUM44_003733 [Polyplax serrata]|uniref:Uncharacterized protein n=1 Tax=Polyplax serrata TaxID=468196 RepID=A0ABR1AHA2_POLSC